MPRKSSQIICQGPGFDYSLRYSARRRTIGISVSIEGVQVAAPAGVSEAVILQFVAQKQDWVQRKLALFQQRAQEIPAPRYRQGERLPLLGEALALELAPGLKGGVQRQGGRLLVPTDPRWSESQRQPALQRRIHQWYREQAREHFTAASQGLANRMGLGFTEVRVRRTKSQWGHCTGKGVLQYNWLLLAAPRAVVDYVVAHEVCHLAQPNHSPAFWRLVESACPAYRAHRRWLKENGHRLVV